MGARRTKPRDKSGTHVELTADRASTRRCVQCACGARETYRDTPGVWALGWGSIWRTDTEPPRRIWSCPECWVPPTLPASPPAWSLAPELLEIAGLPRNRIARRSLARAIARLLETPEGRAQGLAYLSAILSHLGDGRAAEAWRAMRTIPRP
jgi:hypothetical protein